MYARCEDNGAKAPKIAGRSRPQKVADVTIGCIRKNRADALVNTPPIRPLVVLANIAPSITPRLMRLFGYNHTFEKAIEIDSRR